MSSESWPPALKEWVAKCLGQMTEANKADAQAELRSVIADAFSGNTLWTQDWAAVQLKSLAPKTPFASSPLKRKSFESPHNKKSKKNALKAAATSNPISDQIALKKRATRFQREHDIEKQKNSVSFNNSPSFSNPYSTSGSHWNITLPPMDTEVTDPNVIDWDRHTIVGTSQELFKDYLRLTSEPKPDQIRPYNVLQETLSELKKRWRNKDTDESKGIKTTYAWICNQFKSLRQDLTVQRIKNEFTVAVYEVHGRIALENSDMVEYNSCQATLKTLYQLGIPGNDVEFAAYQILMLLHGRNRVELNLYVGQLTDTQKQAPAVEHALAVSRAISMSNYRALFSLFLDCPHMGAYIMDHFVERERVKALMIITKAYIQIPFGFIKNELGFDDFAEARQFFEQHGIAFFEQPDVPDSNKILKCKPAAPVLAKVYDDKFRKVGIKGAI